MSERQTLAAQAPGGVGLEVWSGACSTRAVSLPDVRQTLWPQVGSDAVLMCIMVCICGRHVKVYYARGIMIEWYTMTERAEYLF